MPPMFWGPLVLTKILESKAESNYERATAETEQSHVEADEFRSNQKTTGDGRAF